MAGQNETKSLRSDGEFGVGQANVLVMGLTLLRSIIGSVYGVVHTIFFSLVVIASGSLRLHKLTTILSRVWAMVLLFVFGIRVHVRGEELLPEAGGGIIVFNHQSHFDIPALMTTTLKTIRFGAKIELFKIPFFGAAMRAIGTLPIVRDRRSEVLKVYKDAEARFRENFIFVLAPEGTRQKEPEIGRFKNGPFVFAINGQVPVIPVVIKGAFPVLRKSSLWVNIGRLTRTIEIEYLPPVSTKGLTTEDVGALVERVRGQMTDVYGR